jgi:succinate dehydrogenase / fumarate reductase flavoprotein subunit
MEEALQRLEKLKERAQALTVEGHQQFNPGWHLALDLRNMLLVSECVAKAALLRTESRGGHTRDDHPVMDAEWRRKLLVCKASGDGAEVTEKAQIPIRHDLLDLFDRSELEKYLTAEELS